DQENPSALHGPTLTPCSSGIPYGRPESWNPTGDGSAKCQGRSRGTRMAHLLLWPRARAVADTGPRSGRGRRGDHPLRDGRVPLPDRLRGPHSVGAGGGRGAPRPERLRRPHRRSAASGKRLAGRAGGHRRRPGAIPGDPHHPALGVRLRRAGPGGAPARRRRGPARTAPAVRSRRLPGGPSQGSPVTVSLIDRILAPGGVRALLQPVYRISGTARAVHAVECLARGPVGTNAEAAPVLFDYVRRKREEARVDRICIAAALSAVREGRDQVRVCINAHASTLGRDETFPAFFAALLKAYRVEPERIVLELVEHGPALDFKGFARSLHDLRDLGMRLAIDDL